MRRQQALGIVLILLLAGCKSTPPAAEPPAESLSPVYTDWSKLTPYEVPQAIYTRRYEDFTDTLIPADDYGPLIPFSGAALSRSWSGGWTDTYHLSGLVTLEGEVVVDPVFSSVTEIVEYDDIGHIAYDPGVLLLTKSVVGSEGEPESRSALCARDGSWCTDFLYSYNWETFSRVSLSQGIPLLKKGEQLAFLDPDNGEELRFIDLSSYYLSAYSSLTDVTVDPDEGWITLSFYHWDEESRSSSYTFVCLDPIGSIHPLPQDTTYVFQHGEGLIPARNSDGYYGYADAEGNWAIPPVYNAVQPFSGGAALVRDADYCYYFIDRTGQAVSEPIFCDYIQRCGDFWYFLGYNYDVAAVYDKDHQPIDSPLVGLPDSISFVGDDWAAVQDGEAWILARGTEVHRYPASLGELQAVQGDRVLFAVRDQVENVVVWSPCTLTDLKGREIAQWRGYFYIWFSSDSITGEPYLAGYGNDGTQTTLWDLDGQLLFQQNSGSYCRPAGGRIVREDEGFFSLLTLDGETVFYWPIPQAVD